MSYDSPNIFLPYKPGNLPTTLEDDAFDEGDVTLRARDGTKFRVWSHVLRASSGFFAEMFELPQVPPVGASKSGVGGGASMGDEPILLDDDSADVRIALQMISGRTFPTDIVSLSHRLCIHTTPILPA